AGRRLTSGELDAMFLNAAQPPEATVAAAIAAGGRLVPISGPTVEKLRRDYPFFQVATVRAGSYPHHPNAIHTIGIRSVLVCRDDLPEALAYELTRRYFEPSGSGVPRAA